MEHEKTLKMTELDYLTAAPHLQMIKAALPYIHIPEQRFFSLMVKIKELERTIELFEHPEEGQVGICSLEETKSSSPIDMLSAMKPYGTPEEQDFIDLVLNFLQGSRISQSYRDSENADASEPEEPMSGEETGEEVPTDQEAPFSFPLEHLKTIMSPRQQSQFETARILMETLHPFS